jgi:hypothetical protein
MPGYRPLYCKENQKITSQKVLNAPKPNTVLITKTKRKIYNSTLRKIKKLFDEESSVGNSIVYSLTEIKATRSTLTFSLMGPSNQIESA